MSPLRAASLLWVSLLLVPSLLPAAALPGDPPLDPTLASHVVIAVVDTGINPYHTEFRDAARVQHPSSYIRGYPAQAAELDLCLDAQARPACATLEGALAQDGATWQGVRRTTEQGGAWGPLYWIPGTRIIGAVSLGQGGDGFTGVRRVFDDVGHGTATASLAAGSTMGLCPDCLIVVVEGPGDAALRWARAQPWIDVVTNSWGWVANVGWPPPPFGASNAQVSKDLVLQGKTVLFSAGNGPGLGTAPGITDIPDYLLPGESTYTSEFTGPDWVVTVGALDPENGQPIAGTGRPVDLAAAGIDVPAASGRARTGADSFAGTSAATPLAAGAFGHALLQLRRALGDRDEGPRALAGQTQVVAMGTAPTAALPGSPVADGIVTRDELQRIVYATARPCPVLDASACPALSMWTRQVRVWGWSVPTPPVAYPLLTGYGGVDAASRDAAVRVGLGLEPLPARPDADLWARSDSVIRQNLWGSWSHGAVAADLLKV